MRDFETNNQRIASAPSAFLIGAQIIFQKRTN